MERMIVGQDTVNGLLVSIEGIVAVQLNHGLSPRDGLGGIDLDFVAVLSVGRRGTTLRINQKTAICRPVFLGKTCGPFGHVLFTREATDLKKQFVR